MARPDYPTTWIPYINSKDCSQGFCSMYCPQWCYIVYAPPPPPPFRYPDDDSKPYFSPLVIAIMGILATAFLLITYYTLITKYCGHRESSHRNSTDQVDEIQQNRRENCQVSTFGLDDAQIKSIAVFKYKKRDTLFAGTVTDCSVCLSEFQDDESVRLLPMCNHVFHLPCIDTWLKSNSSCPLCRSNILTLNASTFHAPIPATVIELPSRNEISLEGEQILVEEAMVHHHGRVDSKTPSLRAYSDLCNLQGRERIIEIRDEVCESIGRSVSMDHSFQNSFSISDVLNMNEDENSDEGCSMDPCSSKRLQGESSNKSRYKRRVLHCVMSPIAMKRSFSNGRFSLGKIDRGRRQGILPV
jgi:E3 ubiquitin-protein ligase RNF38/44